MQISNPLDNPLFIPTIQRVAVLFILGLGLTLFFGRRDLGNALRGELGKRYLTWLLLAPLYLFAVFVGGAVALLMVLLFILQVVREYSRVVGVERPYGFYLYGMIPVTLGIAFFIPPLFFALPGAAIFLLTAIPILTRRVADLYNQLTYAGRGYLYLVWSFSHLILLRQIEGGLELLILAGIGAALSDVSAYTVGKLFGRHIISPPVHPRKAWEGLLGDILGASLAVAIFRFAWPASFGIAEAAILALTIGVGSGWGDLVSSLAKRAAGTKDWGDILPGHGGLLDRANSFVVVLPVVYYYTVLLGYLGLV